MTASVEDKALEARHLRRLLDTQPGCLMRVASTGEILAANDAAVELLGARERKLTLGCLLTNWIAPADVYSWNDFVTRVVASGRASLETQLITGEFHRKVLFHGASLLDHPDGVSSLLVAAHDISERLVLETAIERMRQFNEDVDGSAGEMDRETEVPLDEPPADGESFQGRFEKLAADHESAMAAAAEAAKDQARLQQELEHKIEQLTVAQQSAQTALAEAVETREEIQREFEERLAAAPQQPKQTSGEAPGSVSRLQRQIEEQQARLEALDTERVTAVKQLAGAMAGRFQAEARLQMFLREHDVQLKAPTDWEKRIRESTERQQQVAAELEETKRSLQASLDARHELQAVLETRQAELAQTAAERSEDLAQLEEAAAARRRLEAELKDAAAQHEALTGEVQTANGALQASLHAKQELQATLEARQRELAQAVTEREAAVAQVEEATAERLRIEAQLSAAAARRDELEVDLQLRGRPDEAALQLQATLETRQTELAQVVAERSAALAQVDEATAQRRRLEAQLSDAEIRREQLAVELHKALASVDAKQELQAALDAQQAELTQAVAGRSSALAQLDKERVDRRQLEARLGDVEAQVNEVTAERRRLEGLLSDAEARQAELTKVGADGAAALARLEQATEARQQLEVRLAAADTRLNEASEEQQRLAVQLSDAETRRVQLTTELHGLQTSLQVSLDAKVELEAALAARQAQLTAELQGAQASLEQSLQSALDAKQSFQAALEARDADLTKTSAERAAALARLSDAEAQLKEAIAERLRLEGLLSDAEERHTQLTSEVQSTQASLQESLGVKRSFQKALEAREVELAQVAAARAAVTAQLDEMVTERRQLEAQLHDADVRQEQLTVELHEAQAVAEETRRLHTALEETQVQLTLISNERAAAQARADGLKAEQRRLEVQLSEAVARREQLVAELRDAQVTAESGLRLAAEFEAERTRLEQSVELLAGQHRAELAREAADQQRLLVLLDLAGQQHQELRARVQNAEQQCREYQAQLDQTVGAHRSLQLRLQALESSQQEALTSDAAERSRLEQLAAAAETARDKHAEALLNREVVLSALAEHLRRLTPLVTTGRVARELAPQLRELVERVDGLAGQVLEDFGLDRPGRTDLELLRAEAVRAGALTIELLTAGAEPDDSTRVIGERRAGRTEGRR